MRKYLYIFKSEMMTSLQYVRNILINSIGYFIMIFIFFNLWNYIYDDPTKIIKGYSKSQMIWYVILTEMLWNMASGRKFCQRIIEDVKSGNIAYNINKPYSYIGYLVFNHFGSMVIKAVIYLVIGLALGNVMIGNMPNLNLLQVLIIFVAGVIGTTINLLLITCVGLFSFVIEDSAPLYWVYSKIMLILGTIFPIEFFPSVIQPIIKMSPIYVINYGPAKLFVDFSYEKAVKIIIAQIIYLAIAYFLSSRLYKKGVKRLNVNGG